MLNRKIQIAVIHPQSATQMPSGGQIWIECQSPVNAFNARFDVAGENCERVSTPCQRNCIVLTQFDGATGESCSLCELSRTIAHPVVDFPPAVALGGHSIS